MTFSNTIRCDADWPNFLGGKGGVVGWLVDWLSTPVSYLYVGLM